MKRIEIYKEDKLILSIIVDNYDINTYLNTVDIACKYEEIENTYSIPLNKGYKINIEI